jgi:hypothetical protein
MRIRNAIDSKSSFAESALQADYHLHRGAGRSFGEAPHILKEHAMWIKTLNARVTLDGRRALRLAGARGATLSVQAGNAWITIDGDPRDIVLQTGDCFVIDSAQPVLMLPLGQDATIDVLAPAAPAGRVRATGPLQRWRKAAALIGQALRLAFGLGRAPGTHYVAKMA